MTATPLAFVDVETTGLDARIHDAWEVCVWLDTNEAPRTISLPHSLDHADARALEVGGYWKRRREPRWQARDEALELLQGATLVGANPAFDAAFLTKLIGTPVCYRALCDARGRLS